MPNKSDNKTIPRRSTRVKNSSQISKPPKNNISVSKKSTASSSLGHRRRVIPQNESSSSSSNDDEMEQDEITQTNSNDIVISNQLSLVEVNPNAQRQLANSQALNARKILINSLNSQALSGIFEGKTFEIENKNGEIKKKSYSSVYSWFESKTQLTYLEKNEVIFKCKICKPYPSKENEVYTSKQKFCRTGNLLKHLRTHKYEIGLWLNEFDKYSVQKQSRKIDPKMFYLVKFFIKNAIAVQALEDHDFRQVFPKTIGKYSFVQKVLPELINFMELEITRKLVDAEFVALIVDGWTSKLKKEYVVVGASLIQKDFKRDVFILGLTRLIGRHNAENMKLCIEKVVNTYEFNKNKLSAIVCDEGSNLVRLISQLENIDFEALELVDEDDPSEVIEDNEDNENNANEELHDQDNDEDSDQENYDMNDKSKQDERILGYEFVEK
ncbi:unnamed protein product [Brachionus calyciflorus]|uniref:BED-type domain-containing protein n=1 Tax=Brachionus calyciflorus TaxID=104777 RepID=A0A813VKS5_9BILA|nr:unnamed protein product [Brachionus calyciflorus]